MGEQRVKLLTTLDDLFAIERAGDLLEADAFGLRHLRHLGHDLQAETAHEAVPHERPQAIAAERAERRAAGHRFSAHAESDAAHEDAVLVDAVDRRVAARVRTNADGRLEVTANIKNREDRRIQVQVSCVFKDAQGFSTGDETPWQTLILGENATQAVNFKSMNTQARTFTVRVRQAR